MHGSLRVGYGGKKEPDPEWNVRADPKACKAALSAAWDITITPLDTCGLVQLDGAKYASVKDSRNPLAKAVLENYRIWCGQSPERADRESSILFDTVAVYLAVSQELCSMEDLGVRVRDDGFTVIDSGAKVLHCAMAWKDLDAFEAFVAKRLADE
jgi:inosine-uridine nucleoside N-ribohydrolase